MSTSACRAPHVSLIHGARRPYRLRPNRTWMNCFAQYLTSVGIEPVTSFSWSGAFVRGLRGVDAARFSLQLLEAYRDARAAQSVLSIVAKSTGGLIAERALTLLHDRVEVDLFLRIAVPDTRAELRLPNVRRIVNVTSGSDWMYRIGRLAVPLFVSDSVRNDFAKFEAIRFRGLSHSELTQCTSLEREGTGDATTYQLYRRLLLEGSSEEQCVDAVTQPAQEHTTRQID